ncbi:TD and POZ domain-containing protein 2-like [Microplitis demolitor]|uniref:TD and POZ domain-containing protein 2-like n=1 Tax=Microplitis demolitor TaxID=69319 RepID=UPI0004CD0A43|nr:TD and POZ domain-containing protein 2-like [Microplitis demolitor]
MTMSLNSETEIVKFRWNIDDVIGYPSWVHSEHQFYSAGTGPVGFDIGLRLDIPRKRLLKLRVRKDDLRPVRASIQINQIHTPQYLGLSYVYSRALENASIPSPFYFNNIEPSVTCIGAKDKNRWEEFFMLDLTGYKNELFKTMPYGDSYFYLKMTIECEITFKGFINDEHKEIYPINFEQCSKAEVFNEPKKIMPVTFQRFLNKDTFTDVTLIVENQELPAHKVILSAHSPYFYAMLTTNMKEAIENRITIENFSLDVITEMLEFFYTGKTKASNDVDVALKTIEVAEMYQISELKEICESTLIKKMTINNVLSIASVADDLNVTRLRHKAINFMLANKKKVVNFSEFKDLFQSNPLLMFEFTRAIGQLCHCFLQQ